MRKAVKKIAFMLALIAAVTCCWTGWQLWPSLKRYWAIHQAVAAARSGDAVVFISKLMTLNARGCRLGDNDGRFEDSYPGHIRHLCTIDVGCGREDVFFVVESGGSGGTNESLFVFCTRELQLVQLSMNFCHSSCTPIPDLRFSDNFTLPSLAHVRTYLEERRDDYGYISEEDILRQQDDARFAYYFWMRDNQSVSNGPMIIRRYPGKPAEHGASIEDQLDSDAVVYTAYFKAGVEAYDKVTDQNYVVFHPDDMHSWPTVLRKVGRYLVIGTTGEALAIVDVHNFHLKRVRFNSVDDQVAKLECNGETIRVNDSIELPLSAASLPDAECDGYPEHVRK
jgi:hypothetical protein